MLCRLTFCTEKYRILVQLSKVDNFHAVVLVYSHTVTESNNTASKGARAARDENCHPKFWAVGKLAENVLVVKNICPKVQNLGLNDPGLKSKIKILQFWITTEHCQYI